MEWVDHTVACNAATGKFLFVPDPADNLVLYVKEDCFPCLKS